MSRRQREEGIVDVIGHVGQAPKPFEGYDLFTISNDDFVALVFKAHRLDPKQDFDRQLLRRYYARKARRRKGRKSGDLALGVDMKKAGVAETDSPSVAAEKLATRTKQNITMASLVRRVRRYYRKYKK